MRVPKCIYGNNNMNNLRTIEAQIVQKLKNNEPWPKFAGSYKEKNVYYWIDHVHVRQRTPLALYIPSSKLKSILF